MMFFRKITCACALLGMSVAASAENIVDISAESITAVRIHTAHHSVTTAREKVVIQVPGLMGGCTSGVFFDANQSAQTLSFALSSVVAKANIKIGYEPSVTAPWGDPKYCALTFIDVKKL